MDRIVPDEALRALKQNEVYAMGEKEPPKEPQIDSRVRVGDREGLVKGYIRHPDHPKIVILFDGQTTSEDVNLNEIISLGN